MHDPCQPGKWPDSAGFPGWSPAKCTRSGSQSDRNGHLAGGDGAKPRTPTPVAVWIPEAARSQPPRADPQWLRRADQGLVEGAEFEPVVVRDGQMEGIARAQPITSSRPERSGEPGPMGAGDGSGGCGSAGRRVDPGSSPG
jgi:hypothetical protein